MPLLGGTIHSDHAEPASKFPFSYKILLCVSAILAPTIAAEALLRLTPLFRPLPRTYVGEYATRPSANFVVDAVTGWRMRPRHQFWGSYRSNEQGFRANSDFDPSDARKKIVLTGDSFTFGFGVDYDKTYGAIIESQLSDTVVYNLGMPGFGLDQIWQSVRSQALPIKPNLIVVAFISPDFTRSEEAYRNVEGFNKPTFMLHKGRLVPETPEDHPNLVVSFLQHHSSLWRVGRLAARSVAHQIPVGEWWSLNEAILDAIRTDCRQAGIRLVFVYIPTREWKRFPSLRSYMHRVGADFVDLTDGPNPISPDMYFPVRDGHLNEAGHRYVETTLMTWIRKNLPGL
jgi:hypothetical protein